MFFSKSWTRFFVTNHCILHCFVDKFMVICQRKNKWFSCLIITIFTIAWFPWQRSKTTNFFTKSILTDGYCVCFSITKFMKFLCRKLIITCSKNKLNIFYLLRLTIEKFFNNFLLFSIPHYFWIFKIVKPKILNSKFHFFFKFFNLVLELN